MNANQREARREERALVDELLTTIGKKMFARKNECHDSGIRHFDDARWQYLNGEHQALLDKKYG